MNEKVTLQALAEQLASRHLMEQADAEDSYIISKYRNISKYNEEINIYRETSPKK